ncbi:hypothetical protein [Pararobbsia silviterrae]|uniref:hypothetical protein n=1 Tax=Pararobbsia silviterrae TaxID=1792498 RepID=UPI00131489BD|nr:hypothetical protein [Pararobbsia silviterrae]
MLSLGGFAAASVELAAEEPGGGGAFEAVPDDAQPEIWMTRAVATAKQKGFMKVNSSNAA